MMMHVTVALYLSNGRFEFGRYVTYPATPQEPSGSACNELIGIAWHPPEALFRVVCLLLLAVMRCLGVGDQIGGSRK